MTTAIKTESVATQELVTPPLTNPLDAEVDIEVLKAVPKAFEINSETTANWLVRRIIAAREYGLRVKAWAQQEQRRAEREELTLLFLYGRQIEMWSKEQIEALGGRRKSIALPSGTVGFRTEGVKLVVDDEDAVLVWVRTNLPAAIQIEEKVKKSILNQHFDATGEIPDAGVHVEPAREKFSIR